MTTFGDRNDTNSTHTAGSGEAHWITSSRCAGNGSCVEVARFPQGEVWVRDGKNPAPGAVLVFTPDQWKGFLAGVTAGNFISS
jgi:hypothetical protein